MCGRGVVVYVYKILILPNISHPLHTRQYGDILNFQLFENLISRIVAIVSDGRAIAQAVSRWLPTAEARVQSRV
jgi:hypothetical protein